MKKKTFLFVKSLVLLGMATCFLGMANIASAQEEKAKHAGGDKSLLDIYHEGGPIMHLIAACSVATLALGGYCGVNYRRVKFMPPQLVSQLNQLMAQRDVPGAFQLAQQNPGVLTSALEDALVKASSSKGINKSAMENAIADECFRSETKMMVVINYLNTFAVMAPMIGLLGTVIGMISSFAALTAGKAEASDLAGGIGEALVATGGGLFLAIPAMFLYFFFRGKAQALMADVHKTLSSMIDLLTGEVSIEALQARQQADEGHGSLEPQETEEQPAQ